ncbi:unnamed protein product [Candidula unifasciata]|uniref:Uncharacterized protein n=1 Tax=Candidula unifasciata TaxID=100452 RepID=A0A8S4A0W5_9EUPU|nr:unnamed protein product [Candidula unifasciata]
MSAQKQNTWYNDEAGPELSGYGVKIWGQDGYKFSSTLPVSLSLHLIVKRHLPKDATKWPQDKIIEELNKIKRVRLDRENIGKIDSLELLSAAVINLYLQCNEIRHIENLECLPNLQVLVLSNNKITKVEGILHLLKLVFLDISENCIDVVTGDEFPKSLIILNLQGNSCVEKPTYRASLIQALPKLKQLDGVDISYNGNMYAGTDGELEDNGAKEKDDGTVPPVDLQCLAYKQLPPIKTSIQDIATEMLLRSQKRLEDSAREHRRHIQEITNLKIKAKLRPNLLPSGVKKVID